MENKLSEKELYDLVYKISKPTFNFMIKRIKQELLKKYGENEFDMNGFLNIVIASMANIDTNIIRWIQNSYETKLEKKLDQEIIFTAFTRSLYDQLNTVIQ